MAAKTISLTFDGYWRQKAIGGIPSKAGIYVVYEAFYNSQSGSVTLLKVIYIGESGDVNARIANHEKWPDWRKHCGPNNEICFSFAPVTSPDRERAEAALIYKHKPPVNDEYKYSFPFDETTMSLSEETALLNTYFTLQRKE
ncbi:MAG: GIY-YIG nuclease family protein [Nitrososphaerota archaeon]|nr:GIY-YIG nuclease family protein [Nitrososphaerota archaeon]